MRISDWSSDVCSSDLRESAAGIEARLARQAAVDHHAHAGQGDAGFGDVGGEDDAAAALGVGLQDQGLLVDRQVTVQRQDGDALLLPLRRSEEHTSELQSLMRISYAVFCLKKQNNITLDHITSRTTYSTITRTPSSL